MTKRGWGILVGVLIAVVVSAVVLWFGAGRISAQEPVTTPTPGAVECRCDCDCGGGLTRREAGRWGFQAYGQTDLIAEQLGLTVRELVAALRDGRRVADLAEERGVALDTIIEALLAPRREALAAEVAAGELTQEQADRMLARMRENVVARLQQAGLPMGRGPAGRMVRAEQLGWQQHELLDIVAETLGMTEEDLLAALRDGKSVAQVAQEKGVALETLVEALLAPRREALAERVAAGTLTQQQADQMLARMREQITTRLEQPWPPAGAPGAGSRGRGTGDGEQGTGNGNRGRGRKGGRGL